MPDPPRCDGGEGRSDPRETDLAGGAELFDVLADETRWAIVRELATHRRDNWKPNGLSFAELRRAAGVDDAGRFNYHLNELRDGFVTQNGDEYVLSNQGLELVGSVLAGSYDTSEETRRESIDEYCSLCERELEAIYEFGYLRLECPTHGTFVGAIVPKRPALERSIDELVRIAGRWTRARIGLAVDGVCSHCWGVVETAVTDEAPDVDFLDEGPSVPDFVFVAITCTDCGFHHRLPAYIYLVDHPAVVAFRHEHGDDLGGMPYLGSTLDSVDSTVRPDHGCADSTNAVDDPPDAAAVVEFVADDERLFVWLDETAGVLETRRLRDEDDANTG